MQTFLDVTLILGSAAACFTALGIIWQKFLGPFVAKPIGRQVHKAMTEVVHETVNPRLTAVELQVASLQGIVMNGLSSDVRKIKEQMERMGQ